jgi:hypothetical protein
VNPFLGRRAVSATADFNRIANLPKRAPFDREQLTRDMNAALQRTDGCQGKKGPDGLCDVCGSPVELRPIQAQALYEIMTTGGLCAPMGVGTGKTLTFLLAPVVLNLTRALGIIPASLIDKTERERITYAQHFHVDRSMQLVSYEALGRVNASNLLETKMPDGIISDESHRLKNTKAACTRRVSRWMREHPETKFVSMSGTLLGKTLRDIAHLARWSLGAEKAPIPQLEGELGEWADCLDERVQPLQRVKPGALLTLENAGHEHVGDELSRARRAFHNRLVATPGVVCSLNDEQVNCSLYIEGEVYDVEDATDENFATLRDLWETPDGWALSEAVDVWRHARELAIGMHYVWDPRPPDEWLEARRAWAKFVRDQLSHSRTLDSEKQVALACAHGDLPSTEYHAWENIRGSFQINQKAIWHDETVLERCAKWLDRSGICWVDHTFFGRALSQRTKLPYYGQNGLDAQGKSILDAKGPIIASVAANGTGKNLQAWNRNLIVSCPTGASVWEQLLGRTHRQGQRADEVTVDVLMGCVEHFDAWKRARAEAKMAADMLGAPQKLLVADVEMPSDARLSGKRWVKSTQNVLTP